MPPAAAAKRASRLNLRSTARQKRLFETVASRRGITVTEFVLQSAQQRAEEILAEERHFVVSHERWKTFVAALERPARPKPALRQLLREPASSNAVSDRGPGPLDGRETLGRS